MNINQNKFLHYVLIILLMLAPLRSVMAVQLDSCDMAEMNMDDTSMTMSTSAQSHDMHDMSSHDMSAMHSQDDDSVPGNQCCCCDSDCLSNCDMSVTASLLVQASSYTPVFVNASSSISYISELLLRALSPPSRPPATLS